MQLECTYNSFGVFNNQFKIGPAKWKYFDLLFVHDGHIAIWLGGADPLELRTGQSVLIYPNTEFHGHSVAPSTRVSVQHFAISCSKGLSENIADLQGKTNGYECFENIPDRQVQRDIERLVGLRQSTTQCRELTKEMMSSLMTLILLGIYQARNSVQHMRKEIFEDLRTFFENNLDRNISLDEMAEICGLSKSHFRASFKKHFFQSPGEFFRNLRISEAARKLRETNIPIKKISRQSGFDMLPNFYRTFRNTYGMSPAEYRRKNILKG